jgi:hypothetical protein
MTIRSAGGTGRRVRPEAYCATKGCRLREGHDGPCGEPGKLATARALRSAAARMMRESAKMVASIGPNDTEGSRARFDGRSEAYWHAAGILEKRADRLTVRKRTVRR